MDVGGSFWMFVVGTWFLLGVLVIGGGKLFLVVVGCLGVIVVVGDDDCGGVAGVAGSLRRLGV
jgi:hypothetical protein